MTKQMSTATDAAKPESVDPIAAAMADMGPAILEHLEAEHADAVLLITRTLGGSPDSASARVVGLDRNGADIVATDAQGEHDVRVTFPAPLDNVMELRSTFIELAAEARVQSGGNEPTSIEAESAELSQIRTFVTTVVAVADVHPHLRKITLGGGDLDRFTPLGPDTFVYLLLPPPGRRELTVDHTFTWEAFEAMPEEQRPVGAYYTVSEWRPDNAELDILMVLHGDEGPSSAWAAKAAPGDPVALWGPRQAFEPPNDTECYVLVADDTALPAVANILATMPDGVNARLVAEVGEPAEQQALPVSPRIQVTWLYRRGAAAGATTLLADAVRAMRWPEGRPYVWGGGESHTMTSIRRYVRDEIGLERAAVSLTAYWRRTSGGAGDEAATA